MTAMLAEAPEVDRKSIVRSPSLAQTPERAPCMPAVGSCC